MKNSKSIIYLLVGLIVLTIIVIAAALFFFPKETPQTDPKALTDTVNQTLSYNTGGQPSETAPLPDEFDPVEWTRNPQTTPLQTPAPTTTSDQGFTVTLPPETTPATQTLPPSPGATFPGETSTTPSTVQSAPVATLPEAAPAPVKVTPPKPVAKPAPKTVKVTQYWIQVASFRDRYQAENTAKALEAQGLKGTLTTATVNGVAVVRVRVGPYDNEAEAGKFLAWLKPVKEFEGSYITKVSANRAP